ncbi:MAG: sigma-54-dependent Fis family transcriptional regulator [Deltaproteobacteria bacterium]|nr:sigma-54-dependent Fis family transcriptional regulator [Deltaproteobacteria bacterium]
MERVLVVDDEEGIRSFISEVLAGEGLRVSQAADGEAAARLLERESFHLLLTDLKMPRMDGMTLLRKVRAEQPEMEVIVLTAHGSVETAVEAMKLGAFDYLGKPLSGPDELRLLVGRALERRRLREEQQRLAPSRDEAPGLVAQDKAMLAMLAQLKKVAVTDATVLLLGESGTGKEVTAQVVHRESRRSGGPFVAVNCAALSESLLESEMFGHEKGAFTGATAVRRGRFELADGGTLFLDEVAELRPPLQAKLLRVLQEQRFERVGGTRTIEVDVRIIAATNRDLGEEIRAGRFRDDLYHRLAVFPIRLPPLRERLADVVPLAHHLLARVARQLGRPPFQLDDAAQAALVAYAWPGNVRELANVLERAGILADGQTIAKDLLVLGPPALAAAAAEPASAEGTLEDLEKQAIRRALAATGGNRKQTAARLGIGLRTLYDKLRAYGIE